MSTLRFRDAVAIVAVIACCGLSHAVARAESPTPPEVDKALVARWIQQLGDADFATREAATESLRSVGVGAAPQLISAAKSKSPEVSVRATRLLAEAYAATEFPAAAPVEDAIALLRNAPGSVGDVARRSWAANADGRDRRTLAEIEALGGLVRYRPSEEPIEVRSTPSRKVLQFIGISARWTGGDEGLKLLSRLSNIADIQIYHINGAKVSDEAMQAVADLGCRVERRGAFLGISSPPFFPQRRGCEVGGVSPDSPAAKAGLRPGDLITGFGDQPVTDFPDLVDLLQKSQPGDKVVFSVDRDGAQVKLPVELSDW